MYLNILCFKTVFSKIGKSRVLFLVEVQDSLLASQFRVLLRSCEKHRASLVMKEKGTKSALTSNTLTESAEERSALTHRYTHGVMPLHH